MMDAGRHPKIELLTCSQMTAIEGEPGAFSATIHSEPRYVDLEKCVGCGDCVEDCEVEVPNEFDLGMRTRKAIYRPFPQAVPTAYLIDGENCTKCANCVRACKRRAINFRMKPQDRVLDVGAVVVAVGFKEFCADQMGAFGHARYPNVLSGLEFERLLSASGPTGGHVLRPSDGKIPKTLAWVQCVGSRGEAGNPYCSRFCCMNAAKSALLALQHEPDIEKIYVFYTDLRAFGKGYDAFMERVAREKKIEFVRGRPSKILEEDTGSLTVLVEAAGVPQRISVDMAVLSSGAVPEPTLGRLAEALGLPIGKEGFAIPKHVGTTVVESPREGIYLCGGVSGPQVIPEAVATGSAAASLAAAHLGEPEPLEPMTVEEPIELGEEPRVGVFVCHCGANIAGVIDVEKLVEAAQGFPGVLYADHELFACAEVSTQKIQDAIRDHNLRRVVVAACTPRTHEPVFRKAALEAGLNPYLVAMANIRDQCSWVHAGQREEAARRAHDQILMAVAKARLLEPLEPMQVPMERSALVIGGGPAGIEVALGLARRGLRVTVAEQKARLGGLATDPTLGVLYPALTPSRPWIEEKIAALRDTSAEILLRTRVKDLKGFVGNFEATLETGDGGPHERVLRVGAIVLALGAALYDPKGRFGYGRFPNVITNMEYERMLDEGKIDTLVDGTPPKSVVFIQCVGSRESQGNPGCSRYCCPTTVRQARLLRDRGVEVAVFYRDMRTVDLGTEDLYRGARGSGVIFIRIPDDQEPKVLGGERAEEVVGTDLFLGEEVSVPADLVVLSVGMVPREPDISEIQNMLKVPRSPDGFFLERHPELAPVETAVDGVFICGSVHGAKGLMHSTAQAAAAAAKAGVFLAKSEVSVEPTVAIVDQAMCRGCGQCVSVCPYHAAILDEETGLATVNAAQCKGCGTCAAWCPTGAIRARHFTDEQIGAMVEAALQRLGG